MSFAASYHNSASQGDNRVGVESLVTVNGHATEIVDAGRTIDDPNYVTPVPQRAQTHHRKTIDWRHNHGMLEDEVIASAGIAAVVHHYNFFRP